MTLLQQAHIKCKRDEENSTMLAQLESADVHIEEAIKEVIVQHNSQQDALMSNMMASSSVVVEDKVEKDIVPGDR